MQSYKSFSEVYNVILEHGYSAVAGGAIVYNEQMEDILKQDWEKLLLDRFSKYHIIDGYFLNKEQFIERAVKDETQRMQGVIDLLAFDTKFLRNRRQQLEENLRIASTSVGIARKQYSYDFKLKPDFWMRLDTINNEVKKSKSEFNVWFRYYQNLLDENQVNYESLDLKGWFNVHQPYVSARTLELLFVMKHLPYFINLMSEQEIISDLPVFMFWDQGYEHAPSIVQVCIDNARKEFGERLILITGENILNYVSIPTYIEKIRTTKRAFFSDWLRVSLLVKFGGIWLDSTVLVTEGLSDLIESNRTSDGILVHSFGADKYQMSSWFLVAYQKNNYIFQILKKCLDMYVVEYDFIGEYFIFHSFTKALAQLDSNFHKIWTTSPHLKSQNGLELEKHIYENWYDIELEAILDKSKVHKLSYHAYKEDHMSTKSLWNEILRRKGIS